MRRTFQVSQQLPVLLLLLAVGLAAVQFGSAEGKSTTACQGKRLLMSCGRGHLLRVHSAVYGPAPHGKCGGVRRRGLALRRRHRRRGGSKACSRRKVSRPLRRVCNGKRRCRVFVRGASRRTAACRGVRTYLRVRYSCKLDPCYKIRRRAAKLARKLRKRGGKKFKRHFNKLGKIWVKHIRCFRCAKWRTTRRYGKRRHHRRRHGKKHHHRRRHGKKHHHRRRHGRKHHHRRRHGKKHHHRRRHGKKHHHRRRHGKKHHHRRRHGRHHHRRRHGKKHHHRRRHGKKHHHRRHGRHHHKRRQHPRRRIRIAHPEVHVVTHH